MRIQLTPQAVYGGVDRRRMVCKVVIDRDVAAFARQHATHFHAALDVLKAGQGQGCIGRAHAHVLGCGDGCQCIELVVYAGQRPAHPGDCFTGLENGKVIGLPVGAETALRACAEADLLAPAALAQHAGQAVLIGVEHHPALSRHRPQQMMKLPLDRRQIVKNVRVVKL